MDASRVNIKNKKASFQYFLIEEFTAGVALTGSEIKSIRKGKASISEAYCVFTDQGELWIREMHISPYEMAIHYTHEPKRPRKLLLTRRELKKLRNKSKEKGFTIVPTLVYINESGWAKINIALARGKHNFDKKEHIKSKDIKRDMDRSLRDY
ncbi:MAG: SsrA-binding protein SmpB [Bacteroidales bacterium]